MTVTLPEMSIMKCSLVTMNNKFRCYASCSFGLESVVTAELTAVGAADIRSVDGRVYFSADKTIIARANIRLRCADRVYIVISEFTATTFVELFENVKSIDWFDILPKNADIYVTGDAVRSELMSVSDIQSVSKKAIIESMKKRYPGEVFYENGELYPVYLINLKNTFTVCLNTSGPGLNRRGYRKKENTAPLRENLASGMIDLSRWHDRPFYDVMCGSGTIVIEAAMKARHLYPGLLRRYSAETWGNGFSEAFADERKSARAELKKKVDIPFFAYDIDPDSIEAAKLNAKNAHVLDLIRFDIRDAGKFMPDTSSGTIITNPPYANRMGEEREVNELYKKIGERFRSLTDFKYYIITADEEFEIKFGKRADKKRKLYNGNTKCYFYQFFKK